MLESPLFPNLESHLKKWNACTCCLIGELADKHVSHKGKIPCDVLFVGEAPGEKENEIGKPFVGKSGELLDLIITNSALKDVSKCVTNLTMCRPCEVKHSPNRPPTIEEVENCRPRLIELVNLAKPKVLITVGAYAARLFPFKQFQTLRSFQIPHPSYLLRRQQNTIHDKLVKESIEILNYASTLLNAE